MPETRHLRVLRKGVNAWNAWRSGNPSIHPDLSSCRIKGWIDWPDDPRRDGIAGKRQNFSRVDLTGTELLGCKFLQANFQGARLNRTVFHHCIFVACDFSQSVWSRTIFVNCILENCIGLDEIVHQSPSVLDHLTLDLNPGLSPVLLRGIGLSDTMIDYMTTLSGRHRTWPSCFISYASSDESFTTQLHANLQDAGVRCWYAPESMKIGDHIRDTIDTAIRSREKLLLILSKESIGSSWVEKEVETAFEEERRAQKTVLFPIRIDDEVMSAAKSWAADLRRTRHIGDFSRWTNPVAYRAALDRLLRDLRSSHSEPSGDA